MIRIMNEIFDKVINIPENQTYITKNKFYLFQFNDDVVIKMIRLLNICKTHSCNNIFIINLKSIWFIY